MKQIVYLILLLAGINGIWAQNPDQAEEWNNLSITQVDRENAVTVGIPFGSEGQARNPIAIENSDYYFPLNGIWKFNWVSDPSNRPQDFHKTDYDASAWDNINVPSVWQLEGVRNNKSYDPPLYVNITYPFGNQWPNVIQPRQSDWTFASMPNPVGSYRREFTLPDGWENRDVFVRFNGVEAGFYLWINGQKAGYSEDSYLPAEFNITQYIRRGNNVIAADIPQAIITTSQKYHIKHLASGLYLQRLHDTSSNFEGDFCINPLQRDNNAFVFSFRSVSGFKSVYLIANGIKYINRGDDDWRCVWDSKTDKNGRIQLEINNNGSFMMRGQWQQDKYLKQYKARSGDNCISTCDYPAGEYLFEIRTANHYEKGKWIKKN